MSKKLAGFTLGTPLNPSVIEKKISEEGFATEKYVKEYAQPKGDYLTEHQDISGKLDANKLQEAINIALAQAKESGEFDGADGTMTFEDLTDEQKEQLRGPQGEMGKDGVSATHRWNGTVLTITSSSGTSSADLKGEQGIPGKDGTMTFEDLTDEQRESLRGPKGGNGSPGYTPRKGIDYFDGKDGKDGVDGKDGKDAPQDAIRYSAQTLTDEQKAQARKNIGVSDAGEKSGNNSISWANAGIDFSSIPIATWVKVSDAVVTAEDFANVNVDDVYYTFAAFDGNECYIYDNVSAGFPQCIYPGQTSIGLPVVDINGNAYEGVEFRADGVYFFTGMVEDIPAFPLSVNIPNFGKFESYKPIDSRYLPEELRTETVSISDTIHFDGIVDDDGYTVVSKVVSKNWIGSAHMVSDANIPVKSCYGTDGGMGKVYTIGQGEDEEYGWFQLNAIEIKNGFYLILMTDENGNTVDGGYCATDGCGYDTGLYLCNYYGGSFTCDVGAVFENKTPKPIDKSILPQAEAVPDASGSAVTKEEFNALLSALRNAGYLSQ